MATDIIRHLQKTDLVWNGTVSEAKDLQADIRERHGFKKVATTLLSPPDANMKINKSVRSIWSLSLAQATVSVVVNVCRWSTVGCRAICVAKNGNGEFDACKRARLAKTVFLFEQPAAFLFLLEREIRSVVRRKGNDVGFRLNAFSDIPWDWFMPADLFKSAVFYGYTKATPNQYSSVVVSLTRSISERHTLADIASMVHAGEIPTVVLDIKKDAPMPSTFLGFPLTDGDKTDDRSLDLVGSITGLRGKGRLREGRQSGFIREWVA